jgi:hypothetical protein
VSPGLLFLMLLWGRRRERWCRVRHWPVAALSLSLSFLAGPRESTTTRSMCDRVGVLLEDGRFWVLGFFSVCAQRLYFPMRVHALVVDGLTDFFSL